MTVMITIIVIMSSKVGGHDLTWRHLEDFFNQDKRSVIRMAPKLTERHIHLPPFTNMRVKLATQVFSHSVAAGTATQLIYNKNTKNI